MSIEDGNYSKGKIYDDTLAIDKEIQEVVNNIALAIGDESDEDQSSLILAVQQHRKVLLNLASRAYINKPTSSAMLEAITSLTSQIEKSVRDNRKEKLKKSELQDNKVNFKQMVEALNQLSTGEITVPVFGNANFALDPSVSLLTGVIGVSKIKPDELTIGTHTLDFDGNVIK